jgi:hypothetical protein
VTKPKIVDIAVKLTWVSIAVAIANGITVIYQLTINRSDAVPLGATLVVVMGATLGAVIWINLKVRGGKNWARWIHIALAALSILTAIEDLTKPYGSSQWRFVMVLSTYFFYCAAAALLLLPRANEWFRQGGNGAQRVA